MNLDNLFEVVVYHILIGRMIGLNYWDEFPMMSALVCTIIHWERSIVNYNATLLDNHYHQVAIL